MVFRFQMAAWSPAPKTAKRPQADAARAVSRTQTGLPVATYAAVACGLTDWYVGVPTVIAACSVERIVKIALRRIELAVFDKSVHVVMGLLAASRAIDPSQA
jgi:malate/lactate dehydrogenase